MAIFIMTASKARPQKAIEYVTDNKKSVLWKAENLDAGINLAKQMEETAALWGKNQEEKDRKYYHLKFSFHPDDWVKNGKGGMLTEAKAMQFALDFVRKEFPGAEIVFGVHTDKKHLHVHGIMNSVNVETGNKFDIKNKEYRELKDRVQEMCRERGLNDIDWRKATAEKRKAEEHSEGEFDKLTFAEKGIIERGGVSWKDELRDIINDAALQSKSLEQFNAILKEHGITTPRNTEKSISYLHPSQKKAVRGDTLGAGYTKAAIMSTIAYNQSKELTSEDKHLNIDKQIGSAEVLKTPLNGSEGRRRRRRSNSTNKENDAR